MPKGGRHETPAEIRCHRPGQPVQCPRLQADNASRRLPSMRCLSTFSPMLWRAIYKEGSVNGYQLCPDGVVPDHDGIHRLRLRHRTFSGAMNDDIKSGSIAYLLGRPTHYVFYQFANSIGQMVLNFVSFGALAASSRTPVCRSAAGSAGCSITGTGSLYPWFWASCHQLLLHDAHRALLLYHGG